MICPPCAAGKHVRCQGKDKDDACACQHRKDAQYLPTLDERQARYVLLNADVPPSDDC